MSSHLSLDIRVPASTSNLGPGYDCLGLAFKLYNRFRVDPLPSGQIRFETDGPERIDLPNTEDNLFVQGALRFVESWKPKGRRGFHLPGFHVRATLSIPAVRGLGSSSTAILAGLVAANAFAGCPLSRDALLDIAGNIEGHPDNVTPSLLGGLCAGVMTPENRIRYVRHRIHPSIGCVLVVPDYTVATSEARRAIPSAVPHSDAVFNMTRIPLIIDRLRRGELDDLGWLMDDRLHQPYRKSLLPGFDEATAAGRRAGAAAVVLSGAGSTLVALCHRDAASRVGNAMGKALRTLGISSRFLIPPVDYAGTTLRTL